MNVQELDLDTGCYELPESIGELKQLQELNLWHCESLIRLPEQISQLPQLKKLHLRNCNNLVALPQNIGALPKLQILDLVGCDNLSRQPKRNKKRYVFHIYIAFLFFIINLLTQSAIYRNYLPCDIA